MSYRLRTEVLGSLHLRTEQRHARLHTWISERTRESKAAEILRLLDNLGQVSDVHIRHMIEHSPLAYRISPADREELITLLINLTRAARFHTTNGTGLQCSAVYGEEAATTRSPWEKE